MTAAAILAAIAAEAVALPYADRWVTAAFADRKDKRAKADAAGQRLHDEQTALAKGGTE